MKLFSAYLRVKCSQILIGFVLKSDVSVFVVCPVFKLLAVSAVYVCIYIYTHIQDVPGGMCQTSGGCSLC